MAIHDELEQRLRKAEVEQERQDKDAKKLLEFEEALRLQRLLAGVESDTRLLLQEQRPHLGKSPLLSVVQHGYVILLVFNRKLPSEWSEEAGGGWRESGLGTCYTTLEQAQHRMRELQENWRDYPMEVARR